VTTIVNMTFREVEIDDTLLLVILRVRTQMNKHRIRLWFLLRSFICETFQRKSSWKRFKIMKCKYHTYLLLFRTFNNMFIRLLVQVHYFNTTLSLFKCNRDVSNIYAYFIIKDF